jgi:hypothetical protein
MELTFDFSFSIEGIINANYENNFQKKKNKTYFNKFFDEIIKNEMGFFLNLFFFLNLVFRYVCNF